jgi:hypothetical protein
VEPILDAVPRGLCSVESLVERWHSNLTLLRIAPGGSGLHRYREGTFRKTIFEVDKVDSEEDEWILEKDSRSLESDYIIVAALR